MIITIQASPALATPAPAPVVGDSRAATVVCNGSGGFRIYLGAWLGAPCGIEECVRQHEQSHLDDINIRYPGGAVGQPDGAPHPTTGADYDTWLKMTECKAFGVERNCIVSLLDSNPTEACRSRLEDHLRDIDDQLAEWGC